jgi:hypothetical protein
MKLNIFLGLILCVLSVKPSWAISLNHETFVSDSLPQEQERYIGSRKITQTQNRQDIPVIKTVSRYSPRKATFLSAVLPGLGQAYTGHYWKIPIIYGAIGTSVAMVNFNQNQYSYYRRNLFALIDQSPLTINESPLTEDQLRRGADFHRRNRDMSIIVTAVLYLLNIAEAHVGAHLKEFDLNDDLALQIKPAIRIEHFNQPSAGLAINLKLKR